ncbi:hypothetical protein F4678DRAFT_483259 [Xylaria arbuscula]|nr:hypothetical protein F4678DRAFT_483259 [Xylaria arbuscula]
MVTPTCCAPSEAASRRYSRPCPPYSFAYPDRRLHISPQDNRAIIMADRDDSDQPRKRIAVATDQRTIPSAGDAVSARFGVVAIQETEDRVPIAKTRVSSTERHFKDTDYTYNLEAARAYAHQGQGAVSPLTSLPQYAHDIATGDGLAAYRQSSYPYSSNSSSKGYYPTIPGWTSTYADDGTSNVDYGLNYSSYQIINQEPPSLMPAGYSQYSARKPVYVDPEASSYSYGSLVHRPAVSDSQGFSLSSIAASLPSASDKLHSRAPASSSSYRTDGLSTQYAANTKTSSATTIPEVAYSNLQPTYEAPYSTTGTLYTFLIPSTNLLTISTHYYRLFLPGTTTATDHLYTSTTDPSLRNPEDASRNLGYIYGGENNKLGGSRRDSHSSAGQMSAGSLLSNGHVYVPDSHSAHPTPHPYVVSSPSSSRGVAEGASAPTSGRVGGGSGNGSGSGSSAGSSHRSSDSQRRSAGSLRGG